MDYPLHLFLLHKFVKNNHPNQIQKLKLEWRLNWETVRILCNDFLCQEDWTLPSIHLSHKENQILTACTQGALSHNLKTPPQTGARSPRTTPAHSPQCTTAQMCPVPAHFAQISALSTRTHGLHMAPVHSLCLKLTGLFSFSLHWFWPGNISCPRSCCSIPYSKLEDIWATE